MIPIFLSCGHQAPCVCPEVETVYGVHCCLDCPLPGCTLDGGPNLKKMERQARVYALLAAGIEVMAVAREVGLSRREIFRLKSKMFARR